MAGLPSRNAAVECFRPGDTREHRSLEVSAVLLYGQTSSCRDGRNSCGRFTRDTRGRRLSQMPRVVAWPDRMTAFERLADMPERPTWGREADVGSETAE